MITAIGASDNRGLGHEFLRHVERTKVIRIYLAQLILCMYSICFIICTVIMIQHKKLPYLFHM